MKRSTERILTSHAGSLARPDDLREMIAARDNGRAYDSEALARRLRSAVAEVVQLQVKHGIDIVNDGEFGKGGFSNYARDRLSGLEQRPAESRPAARSITGRDSVEFPEFFTMGAGGFGGPRAGGGGGGGGNQAVFCVAPVQYIGRDAVKADIANLKAALGGARVEEAFMPAIAPGTIEHWLWNEHYPSDEAFLYAIAEAMHEEYKAIVDAGFILQIDDPDLPDAWQIHPEMSVPEYRRYAEVRVDALNHALRDLPTDRVRFHTCWGSGHGPHKNDIDLRHIVDIILKVDAECISIEASNPRHDNDWHVWENVKLPAGKSLMPGVVGHITNMIEHPELVAERLVRYAKLLGRENVIAGTDCGIGTRVAHPSICWAKFEAMAEGAAIATKQLWGR
ncbi:MAG TPA: cobalamin-independent methionine synthase II family protein [Dehalococcoidia bacterium]|nr:cobalamin-independent methionine synthase II family protein [Dehalococcoidia bacterium]